MSHILLVDPGMVARKAMHGILTRSGHACAAVENADEALSFLRRNVRVDLVFTELALPPTSGLALIESLQADCLLRHIPVVVYAQKADRELVKRCLGSGVQNILIKPYADEAIYAEIAKAEADPWRARLFEEEKSFCRLTGMSSAELHRSLEALQQTAQLAGEPLAAALRARDSTAVNALTRPLHEQAEVAGAWGMVETLERIAAGNTEADTALAALRFAADLIGFWLDPQRIGPDFLGADAARIADPLELARAQWLAAPAEGRCPVLDWSQLLRRAEALPGCPVIDSVAAGFQMLANGKPSSIHPLMDQVARDPGLTVQVLLAAHRLRTEDDDLTCIEDARLAVGQLGETRLEQLARNLVCTPEATLALPPAFDWPGFWTYQRGVARIAQLLCRDLEFNSLEAAARTAGQLHDFGLLLLAHLEPAGCQAILEHTRLHRVRRSEAERLFLGGTTTQLALHFAEKCSLPRRYANVLRWIDDPASATEDEPLVAIVSLARDLCRQNQVGTCGDPLADQTLALEQTPEWAILREGLYPSFNLRQFEQQVHAYCGRMRTEFSGHQTGFVSELVGQSGA